MGCTVQETGCPGSAFIKPDQLDPWINDQLGNALLSTILALQLRNFVSCGRADRRMIFIWSLIHGSGWSGLIKSKPGFFWNSCAMECGKPLCPLGGSGPHTAGLGDGELILVHWYVPLSCVICWMQSLALMVYFKHWLVLFAGKWGNGLISY